MSTQTPPRTVYRPRRTRSGNPPPFQLTSRDIDILTVVARYRFLNSGHICTLIAGSPKNIRNRLKGLFEHGFLDRPECQYDFYRPGGGSQLAVYALTDKAARLLHRQGSFTQGERLSCQQRNHVISRPFLEHTLEVADFAINLKVSVRNQTDVELVANEDLLHRLPQETRQLAKPFRLNVPVIHKSTRNNIGVEPDYAFSLGFPELKRRAHFLCEIDRNTMPVERSSLAQTSILRKFLAYQALWQANLHTSHFGWRNFRVLIITNDREHAQCMRACLRHHTNGQGLQLFWFASRQTLDWSNILEHQWIDGAGQPRSLVSITPLSP